MTTRYDLKAAACRFTATSLLGGLLCAPLMAQDDRLSMDVSMNLDSFFGFNPFVGVAYDTGKNYDLTFYGIAWGAGTGSDWGQWTEFGAGIGFEAMDGALYINPQIGFTSGNLLSSGTADDGVVGDGIVPNLTMNYDTADFEGQLYAGWYKDLRDEAPAGGTTLEYLHYWVNFGRKFADYFSVGVHFEELELRGGSNSSSQDGYQWLGPYLQVAKDNAGVRFSAGVDLTDDDDSFSNNEFYKLQFFYSF
jgi:hypothetical protein